MKTIKPTATATKTLTWDDLRVFGRHDRANRWRATDPRVEPYFVFLRAPSRAWPHSHSKGAQTKKFANWLCENVPDLAKQLKIMRIQNEN